MNSDKTPRSILCELTYKDDLKGLREAVNSLGVHRHIPLGSKIELTKALPRIWPDDIAVALNAVNFDDYGYSRELIYYLLSLEPEPEFVSRTLHYAIKRMILPVARMLLEKNADPNSLYANQYPLDLASKMGDFEMIELLVNAGAKISLATKAVEYAACEGRTKMVEQLIQWGFPRTEDAGREALYSNNPSTIDALRGAGMVYTDKHMLDEDLLPHAKSLKHLVGLGLPLFGITRDALIGLDKYVYLETLEYLKEALDNNVALDPETCDTNDILLACATKLLQAY